MLQLLQLVTPEPHNYTNVTNGVKQAFLHLCTSTQTNISTSEWEPFNEGFMAGSLNAKNYRPLSYCWHYLNWSIFSMSYETLQQQIQAVFFHGVALL